VVTTADREVAALVQRFLPAVKSRLREAVPNAPGLHGLLRYHLGWEDQHGEPAEEDGGKALRPVLCLAACEMAGGDWRRALPAAAALELIHNFSLVHDDIQDGDVLRRGRPTLWSFRGVPQAVTAGNAMRVVADDTLLALSRVGLPADAVIEAAMELTARYLEMIEGQYLDMAFEQSDDVTTDNYLDMVGRKTGALIEGAMFLGALVATRDASLAHAFGVCGRRLGLAFQVRDDYLGIWGDPAATGKAVGADIRRKKKSLPAVYLFQHADESERAWLRATYADDEVTADNVDRVLAILDRLQAKAYVQQVAERQAAAAVGMAAGLGLTPAVRRTIEAMAKFFVTRQK